MEITRLDMLDRAIENWLFTQHSSKFFMNIENDRIDIDLSLGISNKLFTTAFLLLICALILRFSFLSFKYTMALLFFPLLLLSISFYGFERSVSLSLQNLKIKVDKVVGLVDFGIFNSSISFSNIDAKEVNIEVGNIKIKLNDTTIFSDHDRKKRSRIVLNEMATKQTEAEREGKQVKETKAKMKTQLETEIEQQARKTGAGQEPEKRKKSKDVYNDFGNHKEDADDPKIGNNNEIGDNDLHTPRLVGDLIDEQSPPPSNLNINIDDSINVENNIS
eukprot:Awhi_evm1s14400